MTTTSIRWPEGKTFAFTIFDDPDFQRPEDGGIVYRFLDGCGFRTTKGVWPGSGHDPASETLGTCMDPQYRDWTLGLQQRGFEIGWHGARPLTSSRAQTLEGFERFRRLFGDFPITMSQHYTCREAIYWGDGRLSPGAHRLLYNVLTRWKNHGVSYGHLSGHASYWGDLCRQRVKYMRNFVYANINTLAACPLMPYHDADRPDVNYWYASSEGHNVHTFVRTLAEENQDALEAEGGACIMYAHFAYGFAENGAPQARFRSLMERLSRKNGWFVPVATLLDYILEKRGPVEFGPGERAALERRWLAHKVRFGTA